MKISIITLFLAKDAMVIHRFEKFLLELGALIWREVCVEFLLITKDLIDIGENRGHVIGTTLVLVALPTQLLR